MPNKPGRPAKQLPVSAEDRVQLESIARSQSLPALLVRRAHMVLLMADGESVSEVARRFGVSRPTVTMCRTRFRERGMAGLHNELKPGRPRSTSDADVAKLIHTALQSRPKGKTHWSRRGLAEVTGLSTTTVHRYLTLFGVQPHRTRSFKLSTDPFFIEKVRDIVGLYLNLRPVVNRGVQRVKPPVARRGTPAETQRARGSRASPAFASGCRRPRCTRSPGVWLARAWQSGRGG